MNNAIIPFAFEGKTVRTLTDENGKVWFVGRDVALLLGYANPKEAVRDHCKHVELFKGSEMTPLNNSKGLHNSFEKTPSRGLLVIPESDVWRLILRSRLPKAQEIEEWIMGEVLPALRQTGTYSMAVYMPVRDAITTGKDRAELRALVRDWSMLSDYDEQVLHSVLRSRFGLSRLSHATFGQIPEMIAFVKEELSVLTGYKDVYALPTKYAPRMGGFDNRSPD